MTLPLSGLGVLVTRPLHQADEFMQQLRIAGAETFALPAMEIQAITPDANVKKKLYQLDSYQLIIFISTNAVSYGLPLLQHSKNLKIAAIGASTARSLQTHGWTVDVCAQNGHTSEDLLALPALQSIAIAGKTILIIRGQGGRELLATTLQSRGARVEYAEVYKRSCPHSDTTWLADLWQHRIQLVCVTSNEILENLYHMLNQYRDSLLTTTLLVPGDRCHQLAQNLGFKKIIQSNSARDNDMLQRIHQWQQTGV